MEKLINQLRTILGTNFALYFKMHTYHWNIEGADFIQYHTYLGDLYTQLWNNTDTISEKIRMLGAYSPVSLARMLELADIEESESIPSAIAMFNNLKTDNDRMIIHIRAGIVAADEIGESAISNFLQDLLDQHQKHAWFLRSITK